MLGILAARLARAVYHMLRKQEAFDEERFWNGAPPAAPPPAGQSKPAAGPTKPAAGKTKPAAATTTKAKARAKVR